MDALNKMSWCWAVLALVSSLRSFMPVSALDCQPSSCGQLPIHPLLDACTSASFRNSLKCINNTLSLTLPSGSYKVLTVHFSNQTLLLENPLTNQQNSCCYSNSLGNLVVINSSSPLHVPNYSGSGGSLSQTQSVRVCPFEADGTDFRVAHSVCIPEYQHCPAATAGSAPNPPSRCISPHDGGPQAPDLTSYKSYIATWVNLSSANFSLSWSSSSSNCSSVNCAASCRLDCNGQPDCDGQKAQINCSKACGLECKTKRTSKILLIGIAVGAVGIASLSILAVICVCRPELHFWKIFRAEKGSLRNIDFSQYFSSKMGSPSTTTLFSYKELKLATGSFAESRLLGDGGFGTVYEGRLTDGRVVAVKKLNKYNKHGLQQFYNEVTILSQVRHINLVQLLGCCLEGAELMLVYEFVPNGTLADHIHGHKGNHLGWEIRLMIAVETAQALAYLHYLVDPPILHRDVKSSNILLDEKFRVKVADFGLSRLMMPDNANHISSAPQGTPGYLDPDYYESYQLTDKSDVYSFGVVLMELISAQRAVDMSRERKEINLASMALSKIQCGALEDLADPELEIQQRPAVREQLSRVAELAFRCLASQKDDRPSMREVAQELQSIRGTQSIIQLCECNSLQCKEANTIETCTEKHTESGSSIHNLISKVSSHNNEVEA